MMSRKAPGALIAALSLIAILQPAPGRAGRGEGERVGTIKGTIFFQGPKPHLPEITMTQDRVCASEQTGPVYPEDGRVNGNGTLPNAFVYVKEGLNAGAYKAPSTPATLAQRRCEYEPHVLGIMVDQPLEITTEDPTTHNIHVMAKNNHSWNVSQQPGSQPLTEHFTRPEIMIPIKCNQHPWMKAYIGVTSNPFYAVSARDGTFTIQNLPPGRYTIGAWTATFGSQEKQVTVEAGQTATADFTFESH
jgi:Carboxypeptidase regulatory-like domain